MTNERYQQIATAFDQAINDSGPQGIMLDKVCNTVAAAVPGTRIPEVLDALKATNRIKSMGNVLVIQDGAGVRAVQIDLHGYHPDNIDLAALIRQAWETGAAKLTLIHGHGHNRGINVGFVNTNTGFFGVRIRRELRHDKHFAQWIKGSTLDCRHDGSTTVKLKANPNPSRTEIVMGEKLNA